MTIMMMITMMITTIVTIMIIVTIVITAIIPPRCHAKGVPTVALVPPSVPRAPRGYPFENRRPGSPEP